MKKPSHQESGYGMSGSAHRDWGHTAHLRWQDGVRRGIYLGIQRVGILAKGYEHEIRERIPWNMRLSKDQAGRRSTGP